MWPAPTSKKTSSGEMLEDSDISSYQASVHHIQAASSTPLANQQEPGTGHFRHWQVPVLEEALLKSFMTHSKDVSTQLSSCTLLTLLLCHSEWALLGQWVPFHLTIATFAGQMREYQAGLMLWKTRSRERIEGMPSWRRLKVVLRLPEWFILDHTTLTTSKEESQADVVYSFLPCLWPSASKSLLYLS